MYCNAPFNRPLHRHIYDALTAAILLGCITIASSPLAKAQEAANAQENVSSKDTDDSDNTEPFKQARYEGNALLIHLPTNRGRALVMPEPVILQGTLDQMPGVELAYAGDVVGFFATLEFTRRTVSFVGTESGIEYQLQIRASERGIVEPLEIIR